MGTEVIVNVMSNFIYRSSEVILIFTVSYKEIIVWKHSIILSVSDVWYFSRQRNMQVLENVIHDSSMSA